MKNDERKIYVYADWGDYDNELVGIMYISGMRGKELFSFEYSTEWLNINNRFLDPDLLLYRGRQYLPEDKSIFGVFADSAPDRWGRLLMRRREALRAAKAGEKPKKLLESDYLLGVYDAGRMGALRFKEDKDGCFLSSDEAFATPPWIKLRELEAAAVAFDADDPGSSEKWLKTLLAPGSSLGGARPKATVQAKDGSLWIAKFPSKHDEWNSGAWEMTVHDLALMCGISVPEARLEVFSSYGSTYLTKRFDREGERRIHFASAMTLLSKKDGDSAADGSSYLEIVSFIRSNGAKPGRDLRELFTRVAFSMAVSNTDGHFRNHGFLLEDDGWVLSPMYDVNPDIYGDSLSLCVDEDDPEISFELLLSTADYYLLSQKDAGEIVEEIRHKVSDNWKGIAKKYGLKKHDIQRMEPAFVRK